jgi:hypothetical protein
MMISTSSNNDIYGERYEISITFAMNSPSERSVTIIWPFTFIYYQDFKNSYKWMLIDKVRNGSPDSSKKHFFIFISAFRITYYVELRWALTLISIFSPQVALENKLKLLVIDRSLPNFFKFWLQVIGKKYVRLYHEKYSGNLYAQESTILQNTSKIDPENLDETKFPLSVDVPFWEGVLSEGQMLYIPPKCWHYIRSLTLSFSVSFWWE